jgi:hypothetical protein
MLTPDQQKEIKAAKHGWLVSNVDGWVSCDYAVWGRRSVYRAKPAPRTVSTWQNVYNPTGKPFAGAPHYSREDADHGAIPDRTHVLRLDLNDGVLTAHIEPTEYEDDI